VKEALKTIKSMRTSLNPQANDPRIDLIEGNVQYKAGDYRTMLQRGKDGARKAEQYGSQRLLARFYSLQSRAHYNLGEVKEGEDLHDMAQKIYETASDPQSKAEHLRSEATDLIHKGNKEKAELLLHQALQIYQSIDERSGVAEVYFLLAPIAKDSKEIDEAYQKAYSTYEEIESNNGMASVLTNWGIQKYEQGQTAKAQQMLDRALVFFRKGGNSDNSTSALMNTAAIYWNKCDLKRVYTIYEESAEMERNMGHKVHWAEMKLNAITSLLIHTGDLSEAQRTAESVLPFFQESGDKELIARTQNKLAEIFLLRGSLSEAKKSLNQARQTSESLKNASSSYEMTLFNIQETYWSILAVEGKTKEAAKEYSIARESAKKMSFSSYLADEIDFEIAKLLIETDLRQSRVLANSVLSKFKKTEFPEFEGNLNLLLVEIELAEGRLAESEARMNESAALFKQLHEFFKIRVKSEVARARILGRKGKQQQAKELLFSLLDETRKAGYKILEYEVLLALGEVELGSGDRTQGIVTLQNLQKEATSNGYLLAGKKAAALLAKTS
jgi:tetratricopeptide (TPR) repeat protein